MSEIQDTLTKFENERHGLINGDSSLRLPGRNSATVTQLLNSIQPDFDAITDSARDILNKKNAIASAELQQDVDTILAHEENFVKVMNDTTAQYQHEAEGRVTNLKVEELILLVLTFAVLLLEGLFVFRPAIRNLHTSIAQLVKAEKQVAAHTTELESKNNELELAFQEAMAAHRKVMPHARVVSYGHYQVQASNGTYYTVKTHDVNGNYHLECGCLMYRRNLICSHSLAAASMHSALLRNQNQRYSSGRHKLLNMPDYGGEISGEVSG
jgi:hypothetical protein